MALFRMDWIPEPADLPLLREELIEFKRIYNEQWLIERHGHRTPAQVRQEKLASAPATVAA